METDVKIHHANIYLGELYKILSCNQILNFESGNKLVEEAVEAARKTIKTINELL